jgi:hypothetical protein
LIGEDNALTLSEFVISVGYDANISKRQRRCFFNSSAVPREHHRESSGGERKTHGTANFASGARVTSAILEVMRPIAASRATLRDSAQAVCETAFICRVDLWRRACIWFQPRG